MLEFYQAYADYNDLMDLTEEMLPQVALDVNGSDQVEVRRARNRLGATSAALPCARPSSSTGREARAPSRRWPTSPTPSKVVDMVHALQAQSRTCRSIPAPDGQDDRDDLRGRRRRASASSRRSSTTSRSPSRRSPRRSASETPTGWSASKYSSAAWKIGNAFSELNDPEEQRRALREQLGERARGDEETHADGRGLRSRPRPTACRRPAARASASTASPCSSPAPARSVTSSSSPFSAAPSQANKKRLRPPPNK